MSVAKAFGNLKKETATPGGGGVAVPASASFGRRKPPNSVEAHRPGRKGGGVGEETDAAARDGQPREESCPVPSKAYLP